CALAHLAGDVDIGQEVHLDLHGAVALARLAAAALDVEREPARFVTALARLRGPRVQIADLGEDPRVSRGVRTRSPADGRLVDLDDLVQVFGADDAPVGARRGLGPVKLFGERGAQDAVDQRRLARARRARYAGERAQRDGDV